MPLKTRARAALTTLYLLSYCARAAKVGGSDGEVTQSGPLMLLQVHAGQHTTREKLRLERDGTATPAKGTHKAKAVKKNVLFFLVDDLRPNLGAYNFTLVKTPNMDWIAKDGLTFTRAYANYPWCAPSRNSFLSGRLPDVTRDFNFIDHFRELGIGDKWRSMPEYFKEMGYTTASSGKFFHKMKPPNNDYPRSWSLMPFTPYCTAPSECPDSLAYFGSHAWSKHACSQQGHSWCAMNISKDEHRDDYQLEDMRVAANCIRQLGEIHEADPNAPFFLGCGFHKPHAPWVFPEEFLKDFPEDINAIPLAEPADKPKGMPLPAFHSPMDIKIELNGGDGAPDVDTVMRYNRRAYYASVAYTDHMIGKVLRKLQELGKIDDTMIVLTGDHGWHLGEQGIWGKMTNFENGLRVPLIVRAPWLEGSKGRTTDVLAELVDLYPTIAEVAGLPHPRDEGEDLNGTSLLPVFLEPDDDTSALKPYALSQVAKPSLSDPTMLSVSAARNETSIMGYSLRSSQWRYTVWFRFDQAEQVPISTRDGILGRELYDHTEDGDTKHGANGGFDSCQEMLNEVDSPKHQLLVEQLHMDLLEHITLRPIGGREIYFPPEGYIVAMQVEENAILLPTNSSSYAGYQFLRTTE